MRIAPPFHVRCVLGLIAALITERSERVSRPISLATAGAYQGVADTGQPEPETRQRRKYANLNHGIGTVRILHRFAATMLSQDSEAGGVLSYIQPSGRMKMRFLGYLLQ